MATENKDAVDVLNSLIATVKDGENGFTSAAEKAKQSSIKTLFSKYATQRAEYGRELQAEVAHLGGDPETSGHAVASLHRGWLGLKEALAKDEDKALIDECEAGEDMAMKAYKEALGKVLPTQVQSLIQKQFSGVQEAHGTIRDLKHGTVSRSAV